MWSPPQDEISHDFISVRALREDQVDRLGVEVVWAMERTNTNSSRTYPKKVTETYWQRFGFLIQYRYSILSWEYSELSDDSLGDTPVPMPNTEVKPLSAENTRELPCLEDRLLPDFFMPRSMFYANIHNINKSRI